MYQPVKIDKRIKKKLNPIGRPPIPIDWAIVDELLQAGCLGTEVAARFDMHPDTLYANIEKEKGMVFSAYLDQKHSEGAAMVRLKQFNKALGKCPDGDNTLLIFLGKVRLKQRENDISSLPPNDKVITEILGDLKDGTKPKTDSELSGSEETA